MTGFADWGSWRLDHLTVGWILWILFFVAWETYTLWKYPGQELTAHLRPVFGTQPLTWWLALSAWLWLGIHLLAPRLEGVALGWLYDRQ